MATAAEVLIRAHGLTQPQRITEGITGRQVSRILKEASVEAERLIAANVSKLGTISGRVRQAQLRAAVAGLGPISTEMWNELGRVVQIGMFEVGQLAADQALDRDLLLGMPGNGILQYADAVHFEARHSVESLVSRRTNGFKLADRIYANGELSTKQAGRIVERALVLQQSAKQIARQVRHLYDPAVPGGVSYAAMRLGRTEIANAHHETSIRLSKDRPWVQGFKWNLSGSHPRPDVCNEYAEDDHDDLGPGVFSKGNVPSKPHPQCLCYVSHVQESTEEFLDKLANGKYDPWLENKGVSC